MGSRSGTCSHSLRRGPIVILVSRFTPGTRVVTYLAAGLLRTSFWRFALFLAIAVALWTPLLVGIARVVLYRRRLDAEAQRVADLRAALADIDKPLSLDARLRSGLARFTIDVGEGDADVRRWRGKLTRVDGLREKLLVLDSAAVVPAGVA